MARYRLPKRPDATRIVLSRVAAARVQTASTAAAVEAEIQTVADGVPADLANELTQIKQRLDDLETP